MAENTKDRVVPIKGLACPYNEVSIIIFSLIAISNSFNPPFCMKISESVGFAPTLNEVSKSKVEQLRKLISVTEPYYALSNLQISDDVLTANMPMELTNHHEYKCMSIAEVGRHMAILGSLAMANANPRKERHYYLATDAYLEKKESEVNAEDGMFLGKVYVDSINKRVGVVNGELYTPKGELHYSIKVQYSILHQTIFDRMFGAGKQQTHSTEIEVT